MPLRPAVCLAVFAAVVLALAPQALPATPAPCVATGTLALLAPGQAVPTVVGPTIAAADREGTTADAVSDPATGLRIARTQLGVAGCVGTGAPGGTSVHAEDWSILGGAVHADTLDADLVPVAGSGSGWRLRARHDGLDVPVGQDVPVGNWGFLQAQVTVDAGAGEPLRWWRAALALRLVRAHDGLAAGTTLLIGWVSANAKPGPPPPPAPRPKPKPAPAPKPKPKPKPAPPPVTTTTATTTTTEAPPPKPKPKPKKPRGYHPSHEPLRATPPLAPGRYVFPVAGRVAWGDTYGANRSDVPGGWHHGDDLFADLGTPVVAVTDGTVFAVGWNRVGGWRLWLRDDAGDAFYYAHFSGYTELAHNNHRVRRGEVLGFVGNTGDAFTTEPHLHFEVHPNALLPLGYDGAVDPTTYLAGWPRMDKVKAPPPVELPSRAGHGHGALSDFRRLLAIRPLEKPAKAAEPAPHKSQPGVRRDAAPLRTASLGRSRGDGWGAIAAALALLAGALVAVAGAARNGRSS